MNRPVFQTLSVALALTVGTSCVRVLAQPAGHRAQAFDTASGRDLLNYPRHLLADFRHMRLNILVPDLNKPRMEVVQDLTFAPIGSELETLRLDAKLLGIHSVACADHKTAFEHDGQVLTVTFDPPVSAGQPCTLTTTYSVMRPPYGVEWTTESPQWPGRPAQMHTKGAPENNSYWFPCHDFPNVRLTTEIVATVPSAYDVVSNGRLVDVQNKVLSSKEADGKPGADSRLGMYRQFHWLQDKPHAPYLVVLAIGRWDIVDVGSKSIPAPVYAPVGRAADVRPSFGRTAAMIDFFGTRFEEPYPWDKYAQVVVWNFAAGGMENTSATTLVDSAIYSAEGLIDQDPDDLVSHELAHQWFGDLVTCNSWEHVWLNEGWATYAESLWFEHRDGPDGYLAQIIREFDSAVSRDKADAPAAIAMESKQYRSPGEIFRKDASPYSKGASVLHMLRRRLGDDAFFRGTALYIDRFKFKQAETADFQQAMEDASGESLDQFFSQWCERPGHPELEVTTRWDSTSMKLKIAVAQTQKIDGPNPAFEFDLPVLIALPDGQTRASTVQVQGREAALDIDLPAEPRWVAVDPDLTVLSTMKVHQPDAWLVAQATKGPTLPARVQAIRDLVLAENTHDAAHVCEIIAFTPEVPEVIKVHAVGSLKALAAVGNLETCVIARPPSPAVRAAAASALAQVASDRHDDGAQRGRERDADMLAKLYAFDPSAKVRAECIRGLGKLNQTAHLPLILSAAGIESPGDRVRQAALQALGEMNVAEGLAPALTCATNAGNSRTRPAAIEALVKLSKHDPDKVFDTIADAFRTADERPRRAAARALVDLADPRGVKVFEDALEACKDRQFHQFLDDCLGELRAKLPAEPLPAGEPNP